MEKLRFTAPSAEMIKLAEAFKQDFAAHGEARIEGSFGLEQSADFGSWCSRIKEIKAFVYFVFCQPENRLVGMVNFRTVAPEPGDNIERIGNVSLSVRPSERGKGYGTEILRQALDRLRKIGVIEASVTAEKSNAAARKLIRRNGLEKFGEFEADDGSACFMYKKELL